MRLRIGITFYCFHAYISGVEYYCLGLLKAMLRVSPQNDYVVFTNQPDLIDAHVGSSSSLVVVDARYVKTRTARILYEHLKLPRLAERYKLDVLHCTSYISPYCQSSVPYVVTIHDTIALDHPQWCKPTNALYFKLLMSGSTRRASCIIAVSQQSAADLRRHFHGPLGRIRVIPPGIDRISTPLQDSASHRRLRACYGLPEHYILHVGNVEPKKNVGSLLRIHRQLRHRGLPHKLVLVGGRSWRSKTAQRDIVREVASGNVIVTGYVARHDLPCLYQMADLFVFPSLYEGFGFPPLEAMASGTPVVSSSRGALAETLGDAARQVNPCDDVQMVREIVQMLSDSDLREHHKEAGLDQSRLFNWDCTAEATLGAYESVVRGECDFSRRAARAVTRNL